MKIQSKRTNIIIIGKAIIKPAMNLISDEIYESVKEHPMFKQQVAERKFIVGEKPKTKQASTGNGGGDEDPVKAILDMTAKEAIEFISNYSELQVLRDLIGEEGRTTVLTAIEKQIDVLLEEDEDE